MNLLADLLASGFRDISGSRVSARVSVSAALLNRIVAGALAGRDTPLRSIDIQPDAGDQFRVAIRVTWPLVPVLNAVFTILEQPSFPASPILVLRWSLLGFAGAMAGRLIKSFDRLPPGIKLDGDRLLIDIAVLAKSSPAAPMLGYVSALELHTLDGRALIDIETRVPE